MRTDGLSARFDLTPKRLELFRERIFVGSLKLEQQPHQFLVLIESPRQLRRCTFQIANRFHRSPVHEFDRIALNIDQLRNDLASCIGIGKERQRSCLFGQFRQRLQNGFGDEGQRPFTADQQMGQDIQWSLVVDERVERVADRVLLFVLATNLFEQRWRSQNLVAKLGQRASQGAARFQNRDASFCNEVSQTVPSGKMNRIESSVW